MIGFSGLKRLDQTEETMTQTGRRLMRNLTIDERRRLSHCPERLRDEP